MASVTLPRCKQCGGDLIVTHDVFLTPHDPDTFRCGSCGLPYPKSELSPERVRKDMAAMALAEREALRPAVEESEPMTSEEVAQVEAELRMVGSPVVDLTPVEAEPLLKPQKVGRK